MAECFGGLTPSFALLGEPGRTRTSAENSNAFADRVRPLAGFAKADHREM